MDDIMVKMQRIKIRFWPKIKFRNPFASPLKLTSIHQKLFSRNKKFRFTWKGFGKFCLYFFGAIILISIFLFAWFAKDLPTPGKIKSLSSAASTRLLDRNGQELYDISGEKKRIIIDGKDIPDNVKQATIALEDKTFYSNPGIDIRGLARAIIFLGKRGGGSTLTQQYVKNVILQDTSFKVTRKIKEVILSIELEFIYSKDEILTMYLNEAPYGGNNYGVEAASKAYFGKDAKDLTLAEAATLAAIPQRPTTFSPYGNHTDLLVNRRNFALDSMVDLGYITKDQATEAKNVALAVVPQSQSITAPHFVLYVKDWLVKYFTDQLGDQTLAEQKVDSGGLTVVTTLDLDKQKQAETIVADYKDNLAKYGASNTGVVSIDPKTGDIITMVGSVDYYQPQFGAYNIATAKRQPGSSFKPIVYATAFKDKYNPATTLYDLKTDFGGGYSPQNYDGKYRGPVTIRQALGNSLNVPAVKTLALVGTDKALQTASDLGITTLTDKDRYGLSLVLGGGEVEPLEMAGAYGTFANNGVYMPTSPIRKITDTAGKTILDRTDPKDGRQVLDPQVAYEINNVLSDFEAKKPTFTFAKNVLTLSDRPVAAKTGTTNGYRDAWTIGYTPQYVTAVWVGNNDNSAMTPSGGAIAAAPLWHDIMTMLNKGLPVEQFNKPDGIQTVTVDKLSNKLPVNGSDTISDIFASWQVPTTNDDVHVQVRVCKENGLLAGGDIPDQLAEMRTYVNVHSEMPANSNWEGPVLAWAAANGLTNTPPTQACTLGSSNPAITITSPSNGQAVNGQFTISANASAPSGVQSVDFLIDNTVIATVGAPYQTTYNTSALSSGSHTIAATVKSVNGSTATTSITVTVSKDTTPPGNVTGFNGIAGAGKVTLSWVNPSDSDFKSVKIYVYVDATSVLDRVVEVDKPTSSDVISSLTSGKAYRFVAKSVDTSGNESSGVSVILTPL